MKTGSFDNRAHHRVILYIFVLVVLYLVCLSFLPRSGFWITDNEYKFLQVQSILDGHPGADLPGSPPGVDPELRFLPYSQPFFVMYNQRLLSVFSPVFAVLSSLPFRAFGPAGLYFLPFIGTVLALLGVARIAARWGDSKTIAGAIFSAGLLTPLWFYTLTFWEHTLGVAAFVWAIAILLNVQESTPKHDALAAGLITAVGIWFRDELYLFAGLLVVFLLLRLRNRSLSTSQLRRFCLGLLIGLLPLWIYQYLTLGRPIGWHLTVHAGTVPDLSRHFADRGVVFYKLFVQSGPSLMWSWLTATPFLVAILLPAGVFERWKSFFLIFLVGFAALFSGITVLSLWNSGSPIQNLMISNSFFPASPLIVLGLLPVVGKARASTERRTARRLLFAYAALYMLTAPIIGSAGIHWANRFLLVLYPVLAVLAAAQIADFWTERVGPIRLYVTRYAAILAIGISFVAQLVSVQLLQKKLSVSTDLIQTVAKYPQKIVITDVFWVPPALAPLLSTRTAFLVSGHEELVDLSRRLYAMGHRQVLFLTWKGHIDPARHPTTTPDHGLGYFALDIVAAELAP